MSMVFVLPDERRFEQIEEKGRVRDLEAEFVTRSGTLTGRIYEKDGYLVRTELQWPEPMPFDTMLTDKRAGNHLYMDSQRKVAWHPSVEIRDATASIYELFTNYLHMPGYSVKKLGKEEDQA